MPDPTHTRPRSWIDDDRMFAALLTLIFLAAALFNVSHHVMWRDEIRWWQIATYSPTFRDMFRNMKFEGVPVLWYGIIWLLTKVSTNPLAMQFVHATIAAGVVLTFATAAPFGRVTKALFAFGYFPYFEYATISRNYGLVFLFFLLSAAVLTMPKPRPILLAAVLAVLAQVNIWACGFATMMMFIALVKWRRLSIRILLAGAIVGASCLAAYFESIPGPGPSCITTWFPGTSAWDKFMGSVGTVWKGWMPLPLWQRVWWNTNVLDDYYVQHFVLACLFLSIATLCLIRRPIALLLLAIGLSAQMAFTYFKFCGFTRHHGQLFMVLIVACWIAAQSEAWIPPWKPLAAITGWFDRRRNTLLTLLLVVHAISGIGANVVDNVLPFSAGKSAADYIGIAWPADDTIVGMDDYTMSSICIYLRREFYYPQMDRFAPFSTQDDHQRHEVSPQAVLADIRRLIDTRGHDAIFVHSRAMLLGPDSFDTRFPATADAPAEVIRATLLRRYVDSTVPDETYSVYLFHRLE